jgi:hypothetical protein
MKCAELKLILLLWENTLQGCVKARDKLEKVSIKLIKYYKLYLREWIKRKIFQSKIELN